MPWAVRKQGSEWCVFKKKPDGTLGEKVGCSSSEERANAHLRALYANTEETDARPTRNTTRP